MHAFFAQTATTTPPAKVTIDYRYNVEKDETAKNYFSWKADKLSVKDTVDMSKSTTPAGRVDVQTGASAKGSTAEFNIVLRDGTAANGTIFPGSARGILLYAVSPRSYKVNEDLRVEQTGKKLVIRWTHNANSNMLWTNDKGEIELANCASTLQTCDNIAGEIVVKDEFLKAGGNKSNRADIDWNKVLLLMNPTVLTSTTAKWDGKLTASYKNGILTIKGNLTLKKL